MDIRARERITTLIAEYSGAAFEAPRVLEFQVAQALHDLPREREALVMALKQGHVQQLRRGQVDLPVMIAAMTAKGVSEQDARWAIETWRAVAQGVRSETLKKGDAYLSYNKTTGMSYRPPTREQFARRGLIAGIIAGVLVGAFWGGVKAISLGRPVVRTVATYDYQYAEYGDDYESPTYYHQRVDLQFTRKSAVAFLGWIIAGGLIGAVIGGTSALYMSNGSMKFVGGYTGALVGIIAGLMTGHRLLNIGGYHGDFSDKFAQVLGSALVGAAIGAFLGGFRDILMGSRASLVWRSLFRLGASS